MTIIRIKHNRENPYVILNKAPFFDESLSLKAKGLWAQCLSRPTHWVFHVKEMIKNCKEGRRAIYSAIDELIEKNYALRMEHFEKSAEGKFTNGGVEYVFFEFAASEAEKQSCIEEFKKCFRRCGFGNRRDGDLQNSHTIKKDFNQSSSPSSDVEENEPNRTEKKSDRIGSAGSPFSQKKKEEIPPSLEEIEMVCDHASQGSENKINLKHSDIRIWVSRYGLENTIKVVDLAIQDLRSGSFLTNPAGWITNALKKEYWRG